MVDQRRSRRILKQVKQCIVPTYFCASHTTCTHAEMFSCI